MTLKKRSYLARHMRHELCVLAGLFLLIAGADSALAGPLNISGATTESTSANYQGGTWSAGNLTLNSGVITTLDGPLANVFTMSMAASAYVYGGAGSLFINNGSVDVTATSALAVRWQDNTDGFHVENNGVWEFSGNGGKFYSTVSESLFRNESGGIVKGTGGGVAGFSSQSAAGGRFQNLGGTVIATNSTTFHILWGGPHESTGGTWDSTDGTILVGSGWSNLTCTAVGNPIKLGNNITPSADLSILNVTGEGFQWDNAFIIYCNDRTWKNEGIFKVTIAGREIEATTGGNPDIFWNAGTTTLDFASSNFLLDEELIFTNSGTFLVTAGSSPTIYERTGSKFCNSGTLRKDGAGTVTFSQPGSFENHGGTVVADTGTINIAPTAGPNLSNGGIWTSTNGGTLKIGCSWSGFSGTAVNSPIQIGGDLSAAVATSVINVGGEGLLWAANNLSLAGRVLENAGQMTFNGSFLKLSSAGTFLNSGTFIHTNSSALELQVPGVTIANSGTWEFRKGNDRNMYARSGPNTFSNLSSGVILQSTIQGIDWEGAGDHGIFRNQGTLIVTNGGTHSIFSAYWDFHSETFSGTVLKEGTWNIMGTLTMPLGAGAIDTINTNATVILDALGAGSINAITEASLTTVYGKFGLYRNKQWTSGGALATDSGTHFEFGLDDGSDAKLTIGDNTVNLSGIIDVVDLGSLPVGTYKVIEMAATKTLTVGTITAGTFTSDQDLQMTVTAQAGTGSAGYVEVELAAQSGGMTILMR
ncbi:MAG: hypothetical protein HQ559_04410 [Lentisphaerae bacterium]|nr:hypothetical protein [Lentisphaerota bacterium]